MLNKSNIVGIDYGSKLAGTTSICFFKDNYLHFETSKKGQDADAMILRFLQSGNFHSVFIDSPLSIPKAIHTPNADENNFFYRECDVLLGAMSPMFLGGLTARAIQLKHTISSQLNVMECYPAALAKAMHLPDEGYKGEHFYINKCLRLITQFYAVQVKIKPLHWHEFDSLLAWITGLRYINDTAEKFGDEQEGIIYV